MVQPPSLLDSISSDGFPPFNYALSATAVDIGRGEVMKALMVTPGVVVIDELGEARFQGPPSTIPIQGDKEGGLRLALHCSLTMCCLKAIAKTGKTRPQS
jgi:hypothetical protein